MDNKVKIVTELVDTAFQGRLNTYRLLPEDLNINMDISNFLSNATGVINDRIKTALDQHQNVKVNCFMECLFDSQLKDEEININFKTKNFSIYNLHDLQDFCSKVKERLETEAEEMEAKGSGWSFVRVTFMELRINKLNPLRGGCGVSLPSSIKNSKSVVNVFNAGTDCFKFAMYGNFLSDHRSKPNSYLNDPKFYTRYDWDCVSYPVALSDIGTFEKRNNVSVNVYGLTETNVVYQLRISDEELPDHRDLLLYQDHYCWITNLQRLVSRQLDNIRHSHFCKRCFTQRTSKESLLQHVKICTVNGIQQDSIEDVPIPKEIKQKSAIVFVRCRPENSFKLAIIDGMEEEDVAQYDWLIVSNTKTSIDNVELFQSKHENISVNVYSFNEKGTIFPMHVCVEECNTHRDLLFVKTIKGNYFYQIPDLSRLVSKQKTKHEHRVYLCKRCLHHYRGLEPLNDHKIGCIKNKPTRTRMPAEGNHILKYVKLHQALRIPFVIYADWECLLTKLPDSENNAKSHRYQEHEPFAFCYYIVGTDGSTYKPKLYMGPNPIKIFFKWLVADVEKIGKKYKKVVPIKPMTSKQTTDHNSATDCSMCRGNFSEDNPKVRDHCHLTGKYRQPLCSKCNLGYQNPSFVPVLMHNFSKYDSKFVVRGLGYDGFTPKVLANTQENFISITKKLASGLEIRFLDSFRFMSDSLENLAKILPPKSFRHTASHFKDPSELALICRKQVLCYDYLCNWDVLNEEKLPSKDKFYNKLNDSDVSDEDYDHAKKIWDKFNITNIAEYVKLYLKIDVLILADVFERFRDICLEAFGMDACWQYSSPGLTWQSFLKYTKIELELLTDRDMYSFFRQATRGGISQCSLRHIEADNNEPGEISEDSISIGFVDVVNLYGSSMSYPLPHGGFRWMTHEELNNLDIINTSDNDEEGYLLECDLIYPEHLHNLHNELPFLPENKPPPGSKYEKLLATLHDKVRYPLHIRALRQALTYGLQLKQIHRGIAFKQSRFLKPYIDLNTNRRKAARNDFEKNFFKLMINSCYGKTMENKEKYMNFEIVTSEERFEKVVADNKFKFATVIDENVVGVSKFKASVTLDRPIYIGTSVLDISKTIVYELFYGHFKKLYGNNVTLAYMDTDSLLMKMKGIDIHTDICRHPEVYDTSNYPKDHVLFSEKNQKVPGKITNEVGNRTISEFVGLRSKAYAMKIGFDEDVIDKKRCKGVKRNVVDRLKMSDYRRCLYDNSEISLTQNFIISKNHRLFSTSVNKLSLSSRDNKRIILDDKVSTLAYGHFQSKQLDPVSNSLKRKQEDVESAVSKCSKICDECEPGPSTFREDEYVGTLLNSPVQGYHNRVP